MMLRTLCALFLFFSSIVHSETELEIEEGVSEKAVKAIVSNFEQGFPQYYLGMYVGTLKKAAVCRIGRDKDGVFLVRTGCHDYGYRSYEVRYRCPHIDAACFWELGSEMAIVHIRRPFIQNR
ncbi:hypothetical protein [Shewanella sp. 6_MG-2023]|uniref:hypothetical protein n=1 Tax=Shewanella sp. 6_MG-2023 TaxID=3062660 RepID=UPI0026E14A81|nr:hypothetical protein [Shewanella sp. 6_MG-2023]MDO6619782.1 hypothetical protein [Shewanella sp. 6_MG-2023]